MCIRDRLGESGERGLRSARAKTGFLIEAPAVYESMTASQNLEVQCLLRGLDAASHIRVTLDLVGLRPDERRSVKHYSLGMKQRLGLAVALLGDPEFLVLDEPINGLDPAGVREIRGLLETLNRERGTTILISSHILAELSHTATDYIFLRQGHVVDQFSREEFSRQKGRTFRIITSDQGTAIRFLAARFKCYLAKATGANIHNVDGMVIGGHGDTTMIPLVSKATVNGVPVSQFASKKKLDEAVANTMVGGATLTKLIGTSAWYAPGAASAMMVEAILNDQKKMVPCSCYLEGEYGQSDICIGVPAIIGRKGIEKIVKIDLSKEEAEKFAASADAVRKTNNVLHEIKAI